MVLPGLTANTEFVVEATMQDGPAFTASCPGTPAASNVSGSVNASLIAGTSDVRITGNQGVSTSVGTSGLPFNVNLPTGTNDIAAVALDGSGALAVRMLRSQTVPGALNGGATIILGPSDATTSQSVTVSNLPAGFAAPTTFVDYETANGTLIVLYNGPATQYRAVPTAIAQSGDFYFYSTGARDIATLKSFVGFLQTTTSGGGSISPTLPSPWSFSGPAAAAFPTFTFNYSGFNGLSGVADQAMLTWFPTSSTVANLTVTATSSFQGGTTTLAIPNLTSLPGFLASAASSSNVSWLARIAGGAGPSLSFLLNGHPSNGSISIVQNQGSYTEP
jgi:hypothetical protein